MMKIKEDEKKEEIIHKENEKMPEKNEKKDSEKNNSGCI